MNLYFWDSLDRESSLLRILLRLEFLQAAASKTSVEHFALDILRSASMILLCLAAVRLQAQAIPAATEISAEATDSGPAGIVPLMKGPNLSFTTTSEHDSSNGWLSVSFPNVAWRFGRHFSADMTMPIYGHIDVVITGGTTAKPTYTKATKRFVMGDMTMNGHYEIEGRFLSYALTGTLGLPTGNKNYGLGGGQVTYDFSNHLEKNFNFFTPNIEAGIGDSSGTIGTRIQKNYTTVGHLAHFQAGAAFDLPFHTAFETAAYENLPLSTQILYSTTTQGKKKVTTATNVGLAEDNGFTNTLDIPLNPHMTLSGTYNRSLRSHIDTVGFSLTFLLKAPPREAVR